MPVLCDIYHKPSASVPMSSILDIAYATSETDMRKKKNSKHVFRLADNIHAVMFVHKRNHACARPSSATIGRLGPDTRCRRTATQARSTPRVYFATAILVSQRQADPHFPRKLFCPKARTVLGNPRSPYAEISRRTWRAELILFCKQHIYSMDHTQHVVRKIDRTWPGRPTCGLFFSCSFCRTFPRRFTMLKFRKRRSAYISITCFKTSQSTKGYRRIYHDYNDFVELKYVWIISWLSLLDLSLFGFPYCFVAAFDRHNLHGYAKAPNVADGDGDRDTDSNSGTDSPRERRRNGGWVH